MSKSNEYIKGYIAALNAYSWVGEDKQFRVGNPGMLLSDALEKIEWERDPKKVDKEEPKPTNESVPEVEEEVQKKSHHKGHY